MFNSFSHYFNDFIRSSDLFGLPISLNINRKSLFKTLLGGYVTWILGIMFSIFLAVQVINNI